MSSDIYKDIILDYYRNPRNFGDLPDPDVRAKDSNPLCGDIIEMQLKIRDGKVDDIRFKGKRLRDQPSIGFNANRSSQRKNTRRTQSLR